MSSDASMTVSSNVKVTVLDRNGRELQVIEKHNKATVALVEGLLRFLQGWYSTTSFNKNAGGGTPDDAIPYIPVQIKLGNIGVRVESGKLIGTDNSGIEPTFDSTSLQQELLKVHDGESVGYFSFSDEEITSSEDTNNSESLRLITRIESGQLVGSYEFQDDISGTSKYSPYYMSFLDPTTNEWSTMITEIGLYSSSGILLARVLFDVDGVTVNDDGSYVFKNKNNTMNPVVQTESTTLLIEWRIGLLSIGDNDTLITQSNNLNSSDLAEELNNWINEDPDNPLRVDKEDIETKLNEILSKYNNVVASNNEEVQ